MKKNYFIIIAICLLGLGITAQPVITYSGNAPQIGDVYHSAGDIGSFDPGSSGAAQSWDFSTVNPSSSYIVTAVAPGSTPFAGEFSESNIAFHNEGDNESYSYAEVSTSEMLNDGVGFNPGGDDEGFIHYTDPVKIMQYPFSYSDTYTDSYYTSYSIAEGMTTHEWGSVTVTADAWGSVTTPAGLYNNTLRVKSEHTYTDSVFMGGTFVYADSYTSTDYEWYTSTSHTPVISISVTENETTVTYRTDIVGIEESQLLTSQINIFPNPAISRIEVVVPKEIIGNKDISVFDLAGKPVALLVKSGHNRFSADISTLAAGEYVVVIKSGATQIIAKRFVKASGY